jgi:hypothetical protein
VEAAGSTLSFVTYGSIVNQAFWIFGRLMGATSRHLLGFADHYNDLFQRIASLANDRGGALIIARGFTIIV